MSKLEVTLGVIVHATENVEKFYDSFYENFGLEKEIFSISTVTGHFENPITILKGKIKKKLASEFLEKFLNRLSEVQKKEIIHEIEDRTENSTLHIRIGKQEFLQGKLIFKEKDPITVKIHTPIYNKKDTVKVFTDILH